MRTVALLSLVGLVAGCAPSGLAHQRNLPGYDGNPAGDPPAAWAVETLACDTNADCQSGESCSPDGLCMIDRCAEGAPVAAPPIGEFLMFLQEDEVAVADTIDPTTSHRIDKYGPDRSSDGNTSISGGSIVDLAGGDFTGAEAETYAVIRSGSTNVEVAGEASFSAPSVPIAVAGGDIDGDGIDEVVLASTGLVMVCDARTGGCDTIPVGSGLLKDVATGDIDGDSFEEILVIEERDGVNHVVAVNGNTDVTGESNTWDVEVGSINPLRLTAGDTDGDGVAELITLWDPWWCPLDLCDDEIHVADAVGNTFVERYYVDADGETEAFDLDSGDTDGDEEAEVTIIGDEAQLTVMTRLGTQLGVQTQGNLGSTPAANRIAMADHDGDAPRARLVEGPLRVEGNAVPLVVLGLPPYDAAFSDGTSRASYGQGASTGESFSETISMGYSVDIGTSPNFFGLFGGKLGGRVSNSVRYGTSTSRGFNVGSSYNLEAAPEDFGPDHGGVVVGWGCFDAFEYQVDDPQNLLNGAEGETFVLTVPVSGGQTLYSTGRYNAMAEVYGLPPIEMGYTLGNPDSYPEEPVDLNGWPLDDNDLVFQLGDPIQVSDVGGVSFSHGMSSGVSQSSSTSMSLGASAGITAFGVSVGTSGSVDWGNSYSLNFGESASFSGGVPAVPDDPNTPEDEHVQHRYRFNPYVYVHDFETAGGEPGSFYVLNYTVDR